ncbi:FkbM family methyltransferase [Luteibacter rhizovicinus]|uniref:FkbM family methyltransferase n=1 Tax=Luteibacter rhizovicinus TaxID=242606 RepID=A0A4R3YQS9_9GAMM|nr:FkbM family methyltransferase [Luteibacter rhizovicinus]TCV94726.1 FkbM family methyltransferase [Luteibacter rhizovicinus]
MNTTATDQPTRLWNTRYGVAAAIPTIDPVARAMQLYGEWAEQEIDLLSAIVEEGHSVLEAGGDYGAHALWLARAVGLDGRVHVAEPRRIAFQQLCANVAINGLANVHTYPVWLGRSSGRSTLGALLPETSSPTEAVRTETIDSLALDALHLLKVNLRGALHDVLTGATETLRRHRPMLYVRLSGIDMAETEVQAIKDLGYRVWSHVPYLYNPANHAGHTANVFPGIVQQNAIAAPVESRFEFEERLEL